MHVAFTGRCQSNMGFRKHTHHLEGGKKWGNLLCEETENIATWWIRHRHVVNGATRLWAKENPEKYDSKIILGKSDYKFSELFLKSISRTHLGRLGRICPDRDAGLGWSSKPKALRRSAFSTRYAHRSCSARHRPRRPSETLWTCFSFFTLLNFQMPDIPFPKIR